jgi:hypothetical protein
MRIFMTHDVQGNIQAAVISSADAPFATMTAGTGPFLTSEIDTSELPPGLDFSDLETSAGKLVELTQQLQDFRVETGVKAKIIRGS